MRPQRPERHLAAPIVFTDSFAGLGENAEMKSSKKDDIEAIRASNLFDAEWYLKTYPDVKALGMDPLEHYLWLGAKLNRNPSLKFDTKGYLSQNTDVADARINPLVHYVCSGKHHAIAPILDTALTGEPANRTTAKPVIIYESHNLKLQGAPNSLFEIASGVKRNGHFHPILMAPEMGPLSEAYQKQDIECVAHSISSKRLNNPKDRDRNILKLADFYRRAGGALVHANTLQNFHCILAASIAGIPAVWNIRESEDPTTYYDYLAPDLRKIAYSSFDRTASVIFVAEATRRRWRSLLDGTVPNTTILNGIDSSRLMRLVYGTNRPALRRASGVGENDLLLLNVGTVAPRKGQQDLVDAMMRLDKTVRQRIVLAIAGFNESDYSRTILAQLEVLEKQGLRFIAIQESTSEVERRKVAELYSAADVFILASRVESYPRVILEAMEFGLPIISTPCFGVQEQLIDGESGLFYNQGEIEQLCEHICFLSTSPQAMRKLGVAARQRLAGLNSYDQMVADYESVYKRILAPLICEI